MRILGVACTCTTSKFRRQQNIVAKDYSKKRFLHLPIIYVYKAVELKVSDLKSLLASLKSAQQVMDKQQLKFLL